MARNVEINARIDSIEALLPRARACADADPEHIAQDDTFFACARGRLKLRVFADGRGELIAYQRPNARLQVDAAQLVSGAYVDLLRLQPG